MRVKRFDWAAFGFQFMRCIQSILAFPYGCPCPESSKEDCVPSRDRAVRVVQRTYPRSIPMARSVTSDMSTNLLKRERAEQTKPGCSPLLLKIFLELRTSLDALIVCTVNHDFLVALFFPSGRRLHLSLHSRTRLEVDLTMTSIRALEFFSGIGGLVRARYILHHTSYDATGFGGLTLPDRSICNMQHFGFNASGVQGQVLDSFDMNQQANETYKQSFGKSPVSVRMQVAVSTLVFATFSNPCHVFNLYYPCLERN